MTDDAKVLTKRTAVSALVVLLVLVVFRALVPWVVVAVVVEVGEGVGGSTCVL
jgi:hypothetical protein